MKVNDTEFSGRLFDEAIPLGITVQRHSFIDIGILFYKVTDFKRGINLSLAPPFWILCNKFFCRDEVRQLSFN